MKEQKSAIVVVVHSVAIDKPVVIDKPHSAWGIILTL